MSQIIEMARGLAAILQPLTGTRATGTLRMVASGADVTIDRNTYWAPVVDGQERQDLVFKVLSGPNTDKSWTVKNTGTDVSVTSNIGGQRHNVAINTDFHADPPTITGLASVKAKAAFSGGANATAYGSLADIVMVEDMAPAPNTAMARSQIKGFPALLIQWQDSAAADGSESDMTVRRTRGSRASVLYKETYLLTLVSPRTVSGHARREEGLYLLDQIAGLLTDRQNVDGYPLSNPGGVQVVRRFRERGADQFYQQFYVYNLQVAAEQACTQIDARTFSDLHKYHVDVDKPQDPALPHQGDLPMVTDMEMNNT